MNNIEIIMIIAVAVIAILIATSFSHLGKRVWHRSLNSEKFSERWQDIQQLLSDKTKWPLAVIDADKLLDDALKKRGFKGKNMGQRLVSAHDKFSDNDKVWLGHKLRNKLVHEEDVKLTEPIVRESLKGLRQALRDLGALQ